MKKLFKWDGNWSTVPVSIRKYFGRPVTSENNLGVWQNGHFINCRIGDYVVKNNKGYGVLKHE